MRVIATALGYYGQLLDVGQEFDVPEGTKGSWFKPAGKDERGEPATAKAGKSATTTANVDAIAKATK